ncbi:PH domain-containing protein [Halocalculus aciditolerans]|nr:PH domain-containing protein [Halocalculus aciditolerans]
MERLDPRVRYVWGAGAVLTAALVAAAAGGVTWVVRAPGVAPPVAAAAFVAALVVGVAYAVLRYRAFRFELREDTLYIERGVLTEVRTTVPFVRVQHVDSQRGPVERALGLASIVVYTAGSRGADVKIPGLDAARAAELQERLRSLAIESEPTDAV